MARFPKSLRSRLGWATLLEGQRTLEPHIHQIEPTNHCPYHCIMCPRGNAMSRPLGFMELALFYKLVDEIATFSPEVGQKEIELFHFGESLLHRQLPAMIKGCSERGLKSVLSINPPHLTARLIPSLLAALPHKMILSLDGFDQESYRAIRGESANYSLAIKNIETLLEVHRQMDSPAQLVLRIIAMRGNQERLAAMTTYWQQCGLTVEVRQFFPWSDPDMAPLGVYDKNPPFMPCPFPWRYLVVQWDGTVVACCRDYNRVNVVGHAGLQTLREIWNGPLCQSLRQAHQTGRLQDNPLCSPCDKLYYCEE